MFNDTTALATTQRQPTPTLSEFLSAFFPDQNEPIHLRAFAPKGAPKSKNNRAVKIGISWGALLKNKEILRRLEWLNSNRGLYFVVNAGGDEDKDITRYNAFFVENDTLPVSEQHEKLNTCPIPPSIRVETSKSVHAYWLREGECSADKWREIQARLIAFFGGDPSIRNPSRVMRLPFFNHLTYNGKGQPLTFKRVEIVEFDPSRRYTVADMQTALPPAPEASTSATHNDVGTELVINDGDSNADLKHLIVARGRRTKKGAYEMRCLAHMGKGNSSLVLMPSGAFKCLNIPPCTTPEIRRAFGLPEHRAKATHDKGSEGTGEDADSDTEIDVCMADVEPQEVEWLAEPYIPLGKLTIIEGDPDEGKSFAALAIAAAITNGRDLPFAKIKGAGNVCLASAEDGRADTIKPRLNLLGADASRVFSLTAPLALDEKGIKLLERWIVQRKPKMLLFDPLFAYVGGKTDINQDNKVRAITSRLAELAERYNCAIVALRHLTKHQQRNAKSAGSSSIAWTASARSVLLFGHDPEDEAARGFVHTKHNLSRQGAAQGYRIDEVGGKPLFRWTGVCDLTANKILGSQDYNGAVRSKMNDAVEFLYAELQDGDKLQAEIVKRANKQGIKNITLRRAAEKIKVEHYRPTPTGAWLWRLPDDQQATRTDEHVESQRLDAADTTLNPDAQPYANEHVGDTARCSDEQVDDPIQTNKNNANTALNPDAHSGCGSEDEQLSHDHTSAELREQRDYEWQERAAIMEFDGGLSREVAEMRATMETPCGRS